MLRSPSASHVPAYASALMGSWAPFACPGGEKAALLRELEISFMSLGVYWELVLISTWATVGSVLSASTPQFGAAGYSA